MLAVRATDLADRAEQLYRLMQASEMNEWVGGGSVEGVAQENFRTILANTWLRPDAAVLDFGCGIGRTAVPLAEHLAQGSLVGIDMVPKMVDFCRRAITPAYPNAKFHLLAAEHALYDGYKQEAERSLDLGRISEQTLHMRYRARFDLVIAFSVFTHLGPDQAARYLALFHALTRPAGLVLLTAYLDMPWNAPGRRLGPADGGCRDCIPDRPLLLTLYDLHRLADIARLAGWRVWRVNLSVRDIGVPTPLIRAQHGQDVLVCSKIPSLPEDFDPEAYLHANPGLRLTPEAATEHYLRSGYFEERPVR